MKTQNEISLLADQELDAVVGGRAKLPGVNNNEGSQRGISGSADPRATAAAYGFIAGVAIDAVLVVAFG